MCVGSSKGGKITGKGKIRTGKLDFEDVYFVKELKFNLFSVSQMCDKTNSVLFTESECLILSPEFKLLDENQVMLKIPRKDNMYSFELKNVVLSKGLTCLFAKATNDESKMWHMRLGYVNFKTLNKRVKGNLVRGLPSKIFGNDHTCVACQKGKQHKATYVDVDNFKRCCTSYTFDVGYKVLRDFLLHRSSINNSARLSNKFGGFYFSFKFDISGLLPHVITTIAYRIRDKDTSQSKQNLQSSSMTFIHKTLIIPSVLDSCFISSTVSEVKRGEVVYTTSLRMVCEVFYKHEKNRC
ncbi:putative ribonuclease H-like domain-containing protein [Tanacetum coccineum]